MHIVETAQRLAEVLVRLHGPEKAVKVAEDVAKCSPARAKNILLKHAIIVYGKKGMEVVTMAAGAARLVPTVTTQVVAAPGNRYRKKRK